MIAFLSMDKSLQLLHRASLSVGFTRAFRVVRTQNTLADSYLLSINMNKACNYNKDFVFYLCADLPQISFSKES